MTRTRRDLTLMTRGVEAWAHGFLVIDREGRIRRATEGAERWITRYFGSAPRADQLPATLHEWVRSQERARGRADAIHAVQQPLSVERDQRRLTVRLVWQSPDAILLLDETATGVEPAVLVRLGLSLREAEVLAWATAGKTNPAIAALLHISPRTVQTHLERVYRKLGVETRTAAAGRALEAMRDAASARLDGLGRGRSARQNARSDFGALSPAAATACGCASCPAPRRERGLGIGPHGRSAFPVPCSMRHVRQRGPKAA